MKKVFNVYVVYAEEPYCRFDTRVFSSYKKAKDYLDSQFLQIQRDFNLKIHVVEVY